MKEVKICWEHEIEKFVDMMKSFDGYKSEGSSHDAYINGFHIYLYEGQENGGGLIHINRE